MQNRIKYGKKNAGILIVIILILSLAFLMYVMDRFSWANVEPLYPVIITPDTTLKIGVIGDSWVFGGRLDALLNVGLLENGVKNQILSSGHPGANSRFVYQNLFKKSGMKHSSKFIIENRPEFCIVIAGVNDAAGQIGPTFYSHHMLLIINTLLHYNIHPVIIDLPEFGIIETTNELNFITKGLNKIYAEFTNSGEINNIKAYRKALSLALESRNLKDRIIQIDFDHVCDDYTNCPDLYNGTLHLSKKGEIKLSQVIINKLITVINKH